MILYLAADLLWATKIKGVADALGLPARPARTIDMLEARLADSKVSAVLLDLDKGEEALAMISRLRGPDATPDRRRIRILCWGPHVERELFERARAAGADEVLTRGGFDRSMPEVLLRLAAPGEGEPERPA